MTVGVNMPHRFEGATGETIGRGRLAISDISDISRQFVFGVSGVEDSVGRVGRFGREALCDTENGAGEA
jgi:hypothetical protein